MRQVRWIPLPGGRTSVLPRSILIGRGFFSLLFNWKWRPVSIYLTPTMTRR
jgi:hypothetical protein